MKPEPAKLLFRDWNISLFHTVITCELKINCSHYKVLLGTDKLILLSSSSYANTRHYMINSREYIIHCCVSL